MGSGEGGRSQRHVASEITLLCDRHHRERTSGLLPLEKVLAANSTPKNLQGGFSSPYPLHFSGNSCLLAFGGNEFSAEQITNDCRLVALSVDGTPLLAFDFEDGNLLLTLHVVDPTDGVIVSIKRSELIYSISPWDIELVGTTLRIRSESRHFLLEICFHPPGRVEITRGYLRLNGIECLIRSDAIYMLNRIGVMINTTYRFLSTAIAFGGEEKGVGLRLSTKNRNFEETSREEVAERYKNQGQQVLLRDGKFYARKNNAPRLANDTFDLSESDANASSEDRGAVALDIWNLPSKVSANLEGQFPLGYALLTTNPSRYLSTFSDSTAARFTLEVNWGEFAMAVGDGGMSIVIELPSIRFEEESIVFPNALSLFAKLPLIRGRFLTLLPYSPGSVCLLLKVINCNPIRPVIAIGASVNEPTILMQAKKLGLIAN